MAIIASVTILVVAAPAFSADGGRTGGHSGRSYRDGHSGGGYRDGRSGGSYREGRSGGGYRDGHRGGYYRSGWHRGDWDVNFWFGGPLWSSWWYYPYYYPYYPYYYGYPSYYYPYAGAVREPSLPEEYIQRAGPDEDAETAPSGVWYFCMKSKAYYPYVKECPGGWRTVEASPPSETDGPGPGRQPGVWQYCAESKAYYPYVKECAGGWRNVPARPSSRR